MQLGGLSLENTFDLSQIDTTPYKSMLSYDIHFARPLYIAKLM